MKYHWINLFNMNEGEDGFESVEAAKAHAIEWFNECQNGMALHIGIGSEEAPICEGSIKDGKWVDGVPTLSPAQRAIGERYRDMIKDKI